MADFDPDKFLAETAPNKGAPQGFDPDKFLADTETKKPSWLDTKIPGGTPRGYIQGGLSALPFAGMLAGGAIGTAAEPGGGTVVGAGLGGSMGESAKNLGEQYLLGKDKTRSEIYGNPVKGLVEGAANEMGGQAIGKGAEALAKTGIGQKAMSAVGGGAAKITSALSGIPENEIKAYAKNADEINAMSKAGDNDSQEMADQMRAKFNDSIQAKKQELNGNISQALVSAARDRTSDITPIIKKLESFRDNLNPSLDKESIADVNSLLERVKGASANPVSFTAQGDVPAIGSKTAYDLPTEKTLFTQGNATDVMDQSDLAKKWTQRLKSPGAQSKRGVNIDQTPVFFEPKPGQATFAQPEDPAAEAVRNVVGSTTPAVKPLNDVDSVLQLPVGGETKYLANVQTLHQVNKFLQDQASSAYGGTALGFQVGDKAAQAAKGAAATGRSILNDMAPKIADANRSLSNLHDIEDAMNKNMLSEGKTAAPLMAAGSGNNPANAKTLKRLGAATGTDMLGDAEKLATARTFGNPAILPVDTTGKSLTRMGVAGLVGHAVAGWPGAIAAEGLASPATIKAGINTARGIIPFAKNPQVQGLLLRKGLLNRGLIQPGGAQ